MFMQKGEVISTPPSEAWGSVLVTKTVTPQRSFVPGSWLFASAEFSCHACHSFSLTSFFLPLANSHSFFKSTQIAGVPWETLLAVFLPQQSGQTTVPLSQPRYSMKSFTTVVQISKAKYPAPMVLVWETRFFLVQLQISKQCHRKNIERAMFVESQFYS